MQQLTIRGQHYQAGCSQCDEVDVTLLDGQLLLDATDASVERCCYSLSELSISPKVGTIPREIRLPDNGLLSLPSNQEVDRYLDGGKPHRSIAAMESSTTWAFASVLLVPLFLYIFFKFAIPALAVSFAAYVPDSVTGLASRHTMMALEKTILDKSELAPSLQEQYQRQWQALRSRLQLSDVNYQLYFRKSDHMGANAFALPDGSVVVTDELVNLLEQNSDLLNAILLHEIGHVELHHSMRLIAETLVASLAIDYFFGDLGGVVEFFIGLSNTMVQNQFSQKLEWQADNFALQQMHYLGLDKEHFAQAMEKLAQTLAGESRVENLLSTHPLLKDRIDNARAQPSL